MESNLWSHFVDSNFAPIGSKQETDIGGLAFLPLFKKVITQGECHLNHIALSGTIATEADYFITAIKDLGGRLIIKGIDHLSHTYMFCWPNGALEMQINNDISLVIQGFHLDEAVSDSLLKLFKDKLVTQAKKGYIFAIMRVGQSLQLQRVGFAGTQLETSNYSKSVIDDYNYVVKDLQSPLPSGRIVILDGPPGTGKTFLVRSILLDVPQALFVLVPPAMVSSLGGPELLPMLLQHKEMYAKGGPTVFILEDADECLAPRMSDNMNSITSILNIGDGIFGSLFDIRIVATTNAKQQEMDSAVIRAGRLSKRIAVGRINYEVANGIYQRLLPGQTMAKAEYDEGPSLKPRKGTHDWSLAEVYKMARDNGWQPSKIEEPDVAFDEEYAAPYGEFDDE